MDRKIILCLGVAAGVWLGAQSAVLGRVEFTAAQVGSYPVDATRPNIEAGATIRVTARYVNDYPGFPGALSGISAVSMRINYGAAIDALPSNDYFIVERSMGSLAKLNSAANYCAMPGIIVIDKTAQGGAVIPGAGAGSTIDLFDVYFHVKQSATGNLQSNISIDSGTLNIAFEGGGTTNFANGALAFPSLPVVSSATARFAGLSAQPSDPGNGNNLNLNWSGSTFLNDDLNNQAETRYSTGVLSYRVYRSEAAGGPWTQIAPPGGSEPGHSINARPADRNPYTAGYSLTDGSPGASTLRDGIAYYYRVEAIDDTAPTPNETSTSPQSNWPSDTTAPSKPSVSISGVGDGTFTATWSGGGGDVGSYVLFRKDGAIAAGDQPNSTLVNAVKVPRGQPGFNGTDPATIVTRTPGSNPELNGWSIVDAQVKSGGSKSYTGLANGARYNFRVIAFDPADNNSQGYNWSAYSDMATGIPGVAPGNVDDLRALADPKTGDITLRWTAPILDASGNVDAARAAGYGGALLVYTTDFLRWKAISVEAAVGEPANFSEANAPIAGFPTPTTTPEATYLISGLSTTETYYFKVFSYNIVPGNDRASRLYSAGVPTAALPFRGGAGGAPIIVPGTGEVTINLVKRTDGMGINSIGIPFASPIFDDLKGNTYSLTTLKHLIDAINRAAGSNIITAVAYWDADNQQLSGASYDSGGNKKHSTDGFDENTVPLNAGRGYYISVSQNISFKLKK